MAKKHIKCLLERHDKNEEVKARTKQHSMQALSVKEDYAGLVMCCEWITSAFHSKRYTGRFQASRGDRVG